MSFPTNVISRWARLRKEAQYLVINASLFKLTTVSRHRFRICVKFKVVFEHFPQLCPSLDDACVERNLMSFPTNLILRWARLRKEAHYSAIHAPLYESTAVFANIVFKYTSTSKKYSLWFESFWQ